MKSFIGGRFCSTSIALSIAAPMTLPSRTSISPACSKRRTGIGFAPCWSGEKSNSPLRPASSAASTLGNWAIKRGPNGSRTSPSNKYTASPRTCCMRAAALVSASPATSAIKRIALRALPACCGAAAAGFESALTNFCASGSARMISSSIDFASLCRRNASLKRQRPMTPRTALSMLGLLDFGEGGCSSTTLRAISAAFVP